MGVAIAILAAISVVSGWAWAQAAAETQGLVVEKLEDDQVLIKEGFLYQRDAQSSFPPVLTVTGAKDGKLEMSGTSAVTLGGVNLAYSVGAKWTFAKAGITFRNGDYEYTSKYEGATIEFRKDGALLKGFTYRPRSSGTEPQASSQPAGGVKVQASASAPATAPAPVLAPDPVAILKAIPSDATGFLVLRNMKELSGDVVNLGGMLGLPLGVGGLFPAPLDWLKETAGVQDGLDETGSLAFVLLNCADVKTNEEVSKRLVMFVPTNAADRLLAALQAQPDQDIYAVNLMGEASVAAPKGRFLVVSQTPEALRAALKADDGGIAKVISAERTKAYADCDLFGWACLKGFSQTLRDDVKNTLLGVMAMSDPAGAQQGQQSVQKLERFIKESKDVTLGLSLDRGGLNLSFYFMMEPGSSLGEEMKASKGSTETLLAGLPDEPTVLALGTTFAQGKEPKLPDVVEAILGNPGVAEHFKPEQMAALKDALTRMFGDVEAGSVSMANLPPESNLGLVSVVCVAQVKNSDEYIGQSRKALDVVKQVIADSAAAPGGENEAEAVQAKAVADAIAWKSRAEQIAGVSVDQITVDLANLPDATPEQIEQMKGVLGPDGLLIRVAPVDKQHVVMALGGGAERFAKVVDHVKKGESPLAKGTVQTLGKRLPAGTRLLEGYVHVDQLLRLVTAIMAQTGQQQVMPFVMQNPAPIAFCVNRVNDTAQEVHVILPRELILSVREAIAPLMQMMMGGGAEQMDMEMPPPSAPESGVK